MDITFVGNSQNIAHTMSLPNISLAHLTWKLCLTNPKTKKLLKKKNQSLELMHGIKGLPALFFDNLQKTLKKLIWEYMKFCTMTHYITSSTTRKIFAMNCQNTSLKYKKELKEIYSCIHYLKICKKFFKLQRKFIKHMHIVDAKPI